MSDRKFESAETRAAAGIRLQIVDHRRTECINQLREVTWITLKWILHEGVESAG